MTVFIEWYKAMILNESESSFPWYYVSIMPVTEMMITTGQINSALDELFDGGDLSLSH